MQVDQLHSLSVAAGHADVLHAGAHHLAAEGDEHYLIVVLHGQCAANTAGLGRGLHGDNTLAATRLGAVLVEVRSLADPVFAGNQQGGVLGHDRRRDEPVLTAKLDAAHAGRSAAHGTDVFLVEADAQAGVGDEHHLVVAGGQLDRDESIALVNADGVDAVAADVGVGLERGLFNRAALGGEEEEFFLFPCEVLLFFAQLGFHPDEGGDLFAGLQLKHVCDVAPLGRATHIRNLVHSAHVDAAGVGEEHEVVVCAGGEEVFDKILGFALHDGILARAHADDPLAATAL